MSEPTTEADGARTAMMFAYLNGELSADERARFEAMLDGEPKLAAELADWRQLRGELEVRRQQRAPEAGLDAFSRRMRQVRPPRRAGLAAWIEGAMRALYSPMRYAAALLLVVVQAGFIAAMLRDMPAAGPDETGTPATQVRSIDNATTASLRVRFRLDATAREIAAALASAGARIVDGPGQGGFYALRVAEGSPADAIAALRRSAAVDEVVEGPSASAPQADPPRKR